MNNIIDPNGETPEVTAFKHFGDSELHWVILMTNNITDRYYGWPLSDADFERFVNDKYDNADAVHHYEITKSEKSFNVLLYLLFSYQCNIEDS